MTQPEIEEHPDEGKQLTTAKWRSASVIDAATWSETGFVMPSGRRRSSFRLLRGKMGLADHARADGSLRAADGDWWTLRRLASDALFMAAGPAAETLAWLEQLGWLTRTRGARFAGGREPDQFRLTLPKNHQVISEVIPVKSHQVISPVIHDKNHKEGGQESPPLSAQESPLRSTGDTTSGSLGSLGVTTTKEVAFVDSRGRDGDVDVLDQAVEVEQATDEEDGDHQVQLPVTVEPRLFQVGDRVGTFRGPGTVRQVAIWDRDGSNDVTVELDKLGSLVRLQPRQLTLLQAAA